MKQTIQEFLEELIGKKVYLSLKENSSLLATENIGDNYPKLKKYEEELLLLTSITAVFLDLDGTDTFIAITGVDRGYGSYKFDQIIRISDVKLIAQYVEKE